MGGHLCGVLLPENGRRSFVNHCLEPRSKRRDRAELQANVRHFELSRKRIAARMRTCQCMSHFVYNLRSRPLVRDLAARVRGQIASDHCRSELITGRTHWARAGYPFPEVNLPEYLSQRTQNVVLNGSSSNYFCSFKGVPQGSVLGPLLFNLYVADLPEIAQENRVALPSFADDMSLYCSRTTELEACKDASSAMSVLHQAIQDIGLEINAEKTTSMIISPHRRSQTHQQAHCSIYCKDKKVSMVTESRLLGVIVDNNLTWSAHVDTVYSKVARKIGAMKRTSRQLSLKARRSFFLSVIQPDLEYATGACVPSMPESQRQRLLSLWRKAVRCTAGADKHADVYTICGELSITPLLHRWALSFALQVRRCYLNIAPAQLCDKLVRPCHKHSTRGNNSSLYPFRSSSLSGTVSFTNRSPILWNALQSVSGSEISTFSQSRFKKCFLDLLLVYPKFISFTVGDINSCI